MTQLKWTRSGKYIEDSDHAYSISAGSERHAAVLVDLLNYREGERAELARLRDILDRISTEAPGAIPACNCGEGEGCPRCEIRHLLDIYNGRVPDGPYRRPQPVLATYQPAT